MKREGYISDEMGNLAEAGWEVFCIENKSAAVRMESFVKRKIISKKL